MKDFWKKLDRPFFVLAPMEAVTDIVFRQVVARASRPDVYFTEFTNATGWVNAGERATAGRLDKDDSGHPIVAQIWGANSDDIAKLSVHCAKLGFDGIDINMGCPDKSAVKSGSGAALIKNQQLAKDIIAAAKTSKLPVSVKTRLGYSKTEEMNEWIGFLLEQNLAALTIHLRTKREMSKVPAHLELIDPIVKMRDAKSPNTLIIANGDIKDRTEGLLLVQKTGVDGIMIGRGIFHNPYVFEKSPRSHNREDLFGLLKYHLELYENREQKRPYETLKRFYKIYIRDFVGANELRHRLMQTQNIDEARSTLDKWF